MTRFASLIGLFVMVLLAWMMSVDRRRINWRIVIGGLGLQFGFALFILKTHPGHVAFTWAGDAFQSTIDHVESGARFMFGIYAQPTDELLPPTYALLRTFAFGVLPTIVFFSSLMSILYHVGVMQWLVEMIARLMQRTLRTSGAESLSAAANIFVGQTEAPLVIRPYVNSMTFSELNAVMVGGFATVAGGVMAAYAQMGIDPGHLMTASVISAPAALLIAKLMVPESEVPQTLGHVRVAIPEKSVNLIEAAAAGATDGMKLAINVAAMLIAFLALLSLANGILGWLGDRWYFVTAQVLDWPPGGQWTLEGIFGTLFYPFAWIMGIPAEDCRQAGELLGIKMAGNEFIAYEGLSRWTHDSTPHATPHPRTVLVLTYALSGFANFSSIGIQIGGIGAIAPSRRSDLARLGVRAMIGGTLAAFMTACVAGVLTSDADAMASMSRTDQSKVKRIGNSWLSDVSIRRVGSSASTRQMVRSSQNSANTCRQAPHGETAPGATTTKDANTVVPAANALPTATRSAHIVKPYEAFSTLQPTCTWP